jgi:hypothetical protein
MILELARVMAQRGIQPRNTVRYMWYGAEELGLLGSRAYVASLSAAWLARIKAMLNFDMVGSPNFVRFVYDGDNSAFPPGGPGGVHDGRGGRDLWRHRRAGVGPVLPLGLRQPVQSQPERLRPDVRCGGTRHAHPGQAEPRQEPARRPAGRGGCRRHRCRGRSSHQRRADQVARSNAEWGPPTLRAPTGLSGKRRYLLLALSGRSDGAVQPAECPWGRPREPHPTVLFGSAQRPRQRKPSERFPLTS